MKTDNELIAEFMGFPAVTVGSEWDYNRSLDNSPSTHKLKVELIDDRGIKFDKRMAYERYGISYFDGIVFRPSGWPNVNNFHYPSRPYSSSWDWLMPVVEKINTLMPKINIPDDLESLKNGNHGSEEYIEVIALPLSTPIGEAYTTVIKFINWYNNQPKP